MKDYYAILEVHPKASQAVIKKAYITLAKIYHPDTTKLDKQMAAAKMADINEAYHVLSNPDKRAEYDLGYSGNSNTTQNQEYESNNSQTWQENKEEQKEQNQYNYSPSDNTEYYQANESQGCLVKFFKLLIRIAIIIVVFMVAKNFFWGSSNHSTKEPSNILSDSLKNTNDENKGTKNFSEKNNDKVLPQGQLSQQIIHVEPALKLQYILGDSAQLTNTKEDNEALFKWYSDYKYNVEIIVVIVKNTNSSGTAFNKELALQEKNIWENESKKRRTRNYQSDIYRLGNGYVITQQGMDNNNVVTYVVMGGVGRHVYNIAIKGNDKATCLNYLYAMAYSVSNNTQSGGITSEEARGCVTGYINALNGRRFREAYNKLSTDWQGDFQYETWVRGYDNTISQRIDSAEIDNANSDCVTVNFVLKSTDRNSSGGTINRTFQGTWDVIRENGKLVLDNPNVKVVN